MSGIASHVGHGIRGATGAAGADGADGAGVTFAMNDDYSNPIADYSASGVYTATSTNASTSAGAINVYLTDVTTFAQSQGIVIVGAGTAGAEHCTSIASVNTASSYVVLNNATITTVASGALVYHDDTVALQNLINDGDIVSGYLPMGKHFIVSPAGMAKAVALSLTNGEGLLDMTKYAGKLIGPDTQGINSGGDGYTPYRYSTIWARDATNDVLFLGSDEVMVAGFRIKQHPTVTRTARAGICLGTRVSGTGVYEVATANVVNRASVHAMKMDGMWDGFNHGKAWNAWTTKTEARYYRHNGFVHDAAVPYGGSKYNDLFAIGEPSGANVNAGYYVDRADMNVWNMLTSVAAKYHFHQNSVTGTGGLQVVSNFYFDSTTAGGYGIYMEKNTKGNSFTGGVINVHLGTSAWNLSANSLRNVLTNIIYAGTVGTDSGTNNTVTNNNPQT